MPTINYTNHDDVTVPGRFETPKFHPLRFPVQRLQILVSLIRVCKELTGTCRLHRDGFYQTPRATPWFVHTSKHTQGGTSVSLATTATVSVIGGGPRRPAPQLTATRVLTSLTQIPILIYYNRHRRLTSAPGNETPGDPISQRRCLPVAHPKGPSSRPFNCLNRATLTPCLLSSIHRRPFVGGFGSPA